MNSDEILISSAIVWRETQRKINTHVAIAAIGIITEFEMKSKKSRKSIPNTLIPPNTLYPSDDKDPSPTMITVINSVAEIRPIPNSSSKVETADSANAIALVNAAMKTNKKKAIPAIVPSPMLAKTFGIVTNINDGPT